MDKAELKQRIVEHLNATLATVVQAQKSTQHAATHEESKSESDKDMRSTELSYIARGQAMRVASLESERLKVGAMEMRAYTKEDTVGMSAIVTLKGGGPEKRYFVAPGGAGLEIATPQGTIRVVTLASSLGQSLIGAGVGDFITLEKTGDELEIVALA
jgi:hypothetical protein